MDPLVALAALIATIRDVKEGPESAFYLPFMDKISLDLFQKLLGVAVKMGLCTVKSNYVRFTTPAPGSKGAELLAAIEAAEKKVA
jgi:hypothetical protein